MTGGKALAQGPGALSGLKVIDLTRVLGGPYCTMVLRFDGLIETFEVVSAGQARPVSV
jgi:hypothetical protein